MKWFSIVLIESPYTVCVCLCACVCVILFNCLYTLFTVDLALGAKRYKLMLMFVFNFLLLLLLLLALFSLISLSPSTVYSLVAPFAV